MVDQLPVQGLDPEGLVLDRAGGRDHVDPSAEGQEGHGAQRGQPIPPPGRGIPDRLAPRQGKDAEPAGDPGAARVAGQHAGVGPVDVHGRRAVRKTLPHRLAVEGRGIRRTELAQVEKLF